MKIYHYIHLIFVFSLLEAITTDHKCKIKAETSDFSKPSIKVIAFTWITVLSFLASGLEVCRSLYSLYFIYKRIKAAEEKNQNTKKMEEKKSKKIQDLRFYLFIACLSILLLSFVYSPSFI